MEKYYSADGIRNFGIIAHIDAGKTTTAERLLYLAGVNHSIGEVDEGTAVTDWMEEEKERGITIQSAAVSCLYKGYNLHIIDTPGHVDFTVEVQRTLRVLDGAVVILCGVAGVQTQTETVWKQSENFNIPKIVFVNKLDRVGADFFQAAEDLANKFKIVPLIVNLPYYENEQISGTIDLVTMKKILYKKDGNISESMEIPQDIYDDSTLYREEMINILTEYDDEFLRQVLENSFTEENIVKSIRKLTISRKIVPVLSGASFKNVGVPPLLDAIINYLPSPEDRPIVKKYNKKNEEWEEIVADDENFIGYIFKLQYQKEKGNIAYVRIYSGFLENGENIYNPRSEKREKTLDLLKIFSDDFERIPKALRGDIVAIVGLKDSVTGDTLCQEGKNFLLETIRFPEPVIYIRVEPKNSLDSEKFNHAKSFLLSEDPTIVCKEDTETGQTLVGGMGELHLEIFIERLKREFYIELRTGPPSVARRERILSNGEITYNFENKIGGNLRHCKIVLKCEKNKDILENDIIFNVNLKDFTKDEIEHIQKGITNSLKSGPEGAYRVINIKIIVEKIEFEENNLSPLVLEAASNLAVTSLLRNIKTEILEPIMTIEIDTPQCYAGGIIGDLQSRNGVVLEIVNKLGSEKIIGRVPLKELFGYSTIIRNLSSGKASFTMDFFEFGR